MLAFKKGLGSRAVTEINNKMRRRPRADASNAREADDTGEQPTLFLLDNILSSIAQTSDVSAAASSGRGHRYRRRPRPQGSSLGGASEDGSADAEPPVSWATQNRSSDESSQPAKSAAAASARDDERDGLSYASMKERGLLAPTSSTTDDAIPEVKELV